MPSAKRRRSKDRRDPTQAFVKVQAGASLQTEGVTFAKATRPPVLMTREERFDEALALALRSVMAAPENPSFRVGFYVLLSGYEEIMAAASLAKTPDERFRVAQVRKIATASARKFINRCPS
jgi:hypothetical protein